MTNYTYQNNLIGKKQLRQLLAWSFSSYDSMQACSLADELKYLGFRYATHAGISISIEDLKIPFIKNLMLEKANQEILTAEKIYLKGKITEVERFQKLIDTWSLTSESLKDQIVYYFKNYDPLNSVYIMAFSGARGNLSQVRQLVGMRGLMSDPSGQIMNLPIKKNFREGLTITDYLMSGYGARKGIVDTALKTANSGYLTRRLIDVAQDILIREKDCLTSQSLLFFLSISNQKVENHNIIYDKILGRVLNKSIFNPQKKNYIVAKNREITTKLTQKLKEKEIKKFYVRSPLTCNLYRAVCQKCYGWDLTNENLVDIGEAIGILAGQSIGEPGTQLTMRTFHTGGIFTSEARQQIISPITGIIEFYKILKTVVLRTNRGEDVLITKNSGSLIIIPENKNYKLVQFEIFKNTILFPKNNQYIFKDTVIGELINQRKQTKLEIKPILSYSSGEIFTPRLKQKINLFNNNKLVWILSGQLYDSPLNSFLNFYSDYKLNSNSYIFRTKVISYSNSFVRFINGKTNLSQCLIKIEKPVNFFIKSKLKKYSYLNLYFLFSKNSLYCLKRKQNYLKNYLPININKDYWYSVINSLKFKTPTGGIIFYSYRQKSDSLMGSISSYYRQKYDPLNKLTKFPKKNRPIQVLVYENVHRTIIWLGEEVYEMDSEKNSLLVEHGDFIAKGFELSPGFFSKTSGLVLINKKNTTIQEIVIKSGVVYDGKKLKKIIKKLYYPGEIIFNNIEIKELSFCEFISSKNVQQFMIRPVKLYEVPYSNPIISEFSQKSFSTSNLQFDHLYQSGDRLTERNLKYLICSFLSFKNIKFNKVMKKKSIKNKFNFILVDNKETNCVEFKVIEKLFLNDYVPPSLKYKTIQTCFLFQKNQFINNYNILGYLEAVTFNSLEIVKFKVKKAISKQILLISNNDCLTIKKEDISNKKVNDFITTDLNKIGRIILENNKFFTIQKGRPYFFPNCENEEFNLNTNLQYKILPSSRINLLLETKRNISLNYSNLFKLSVNKFNPRVKSQTSSKLDFSKLFLKTNGKLYSCLIPQFFKKFTITNKTFQLPFKKLIRSPNSKILTSKQRNRTLLLQSSNIISNKNKRLEKINYQLVLLTFFDQPFKQSTKSVGLYSITKDYFEQEVNSIFCKNTEFVEAGKTIGFLNLEKEITGDIVQGLPRIEEILEARKKNIVVKRIPTSQKKGLAIQKTSLDINFEFKKLGSPMKETDKVNPHKLLKVYFHYYGMLKFFFCDRIKLFKSNRLINNYEGVYKSFKKVQLFILNSVQSVYQSQGVTINDKHLEIIIRQMTTKVLITYEGDSPLLKQEVIDLYHIHYINQILQNESKKTSYYIPLLLGITKSALNNPSFISAASFQETTRVLTKAAIEGRIDWLRGLKENIIIGNLIPAGTGSPSYRNCFTNSSIQTQCFKSTINTLSNIEETAGQVF